MAIKFAYRGNSMDARFCGASKTAIPFAPSDPNLPATAADATAIGGYSLNMSHTGTAIQQVHFSAAKNLPTGRVISVLARVKFGANTGNLGVFLIGGRLGYTNNSIALAFLGGNIRVILGDSHGGTFYNANIAAWTPTVGVWYDMLLTWDGTNATNAVKLYIDGTLAGQGTTSGSHSTSNPFGVIDSITFGAAAADVGTTNIYLSEFVIWDEIVNPTTLGLTGATRVAFVDVENVIGDFYDNITAANLRYGPFYYIAGVQVGGELEQVIIYVGRLVGRIQAASNFGQEVKTITQGEVPEIVCEIQNSDGTVVNLADLASAEARFAGTGTEVPVTDYTVLDAANGVIKFSPVDGATDNWAEQTKGTFRALLTFNSGKVYCAWFEKCLTVRKGSLV